MVWTLTEDLDSYTAEVCDFLLARPVRHTVLLSVLGTLRAQGSSAYSTAPPLFGWWRPPAAATGGAFLVTPPFPVLLTRVPKRPARLLAEALAARQTPVAGVNSERGTAEAFATAWHDLTGAEPKTHRRNRLFRLDVIVPPEPSPPGSRLASALDRDLLESWFDAFSR
jgi:hypothetical protein